MLYRLSAEICQTWFLGYQITKSENGLLIIVCIIPCVGLMLRISRE